MKVIRTIKIPQKAFFTAEDFDLAEIWRDPSSRALLISNLVVLGFAVAQKWNFLNLLWVYFFQNLIIGFFVYLKILFFGNSAKLRDMIRLEVLGKERKISTSKAGFWTALFFALHYGFFHFVYFIFLMSFSSNKISMFWQPVLISSAIFFANHLISFILNFKKDKNAIIGQALGIKNLMLLAYRRVIPMHLIIIFGGMFFARGLFPWPFLVVFVLLKTIVDIKMHRRDHAREGAIPNLEQAI